MWICLNEAYLSIVNDPKDNNLLLVRARRAGDIERIFPEHKAVTIRGRDYQFRASIPRDEVSSTIAVCLLKINYGNFKNSVKDGRLHDAYARVWGVMAKLQPQQPYSDYKTGRAKKPQTDFFGGNVEYPNGI